MFPTGWALGVLSRLLAKRLLDDNRELVISIISLPPTQIVSALKSEKLKTFKLLAETKGERIVASRIAETLTGTQYRMPDYDFRAVTKALIIKGINSARGIGCDSFTAQGSDTVKWRVKAQLNCLTKTLQIGGGRPIDPLQLSGNS
ncbi:hypothetical protein ASE80_13310 [Pseudomonas sp. Leaf15]|uniref:Uncharacterized protein n=1 Tax=Pseudomonas fluorescens ICMP 11288 TaxID=1198309 RepID=A0A0W0HP47_PSEFL|nr:hypothetical protein ASE80_13310 [Pseudomonas sp. Leaf15]KTB62741.1 hypothetical protein AO063_10870 [Pseudomonas fluorescens ICMP 11288]RAH01916.1 hypothetical protein DJ480_15790 [Pseudomonas sp. Leaf98]